MDELKLLEADVAETEAAGLGAADRYLQDSDDEEDDESVSLSQSPERRRRRLSSSAGVDRRLGGAPRPFRLRFDTSV